MVSFMYGCLIVGKQDRSLIWTSGVIRHTSSTGLETVPARGSIRGTTSLRVIYASRRSQSRPLNWDNELVDIAGSISTLMGVPGSRSRHSWVRPRPGEGHSRPMRKTSAPDQGIYIMSRRRNLFPCRFVTRHEPPNRPIWLSSLIAFQTIRRETSVAAAYEENGSLFPTTWSRSKRLYV